MAGKVLNIKVCSPLKLRSGLTGNYHAICHYSYNLPLGILNRSSMPSNFNPPDRFLSNFSGTQKRISEVDSILGNDFSQKISEALSDQIKHSEPYEDSLVTYSTDEESQLQVHVQILYSDFIHSILNAFFLRFHRSRTKKSEKDKLVGTWRLIEYADFDSINNKWTHPYGNNPKGYFTYTKSGIVNLNGSAEKPLEIPTDSIYTKPLSLGEVLDNAFGYFGTYTIDSTNSIVTHHVEGGSVIPYIGTDQPRQFIIKGDTLFIGDPTFEIGKRVLVREE